MTMTKRVQVLMEPSEYEVLERLARKRGASVSNLMREAMREQLLLPSGAFVHQEAARQFLGLSDSPLPSWAALKSEIENRRG